MTDFWVWILSAGSANKGEGVVGVSSEKSGSAK